MVRMPRRLCALGGWVVVALLLAPLTPAHAQQAPDAGQPSPESSGASLAPGAPTITTDGSEAQETRAEEDRAARRAPRARARIDRGRRRGRIT